MNNCKSKIDNLLPQLEQYSEHDPDKFEALRQEIITSAIESFPERYRQRALGIQFTLDCELRKYKDPVARMNRMVELFWEKVNELNLALNNPTAMMAVREDEKKRVPAKVIPLFSK